ncbi:SIS domain-containing protein [Pseudoalteromonas sp. SWXJZ94C]|uniref:SIS domain-containing protein n=1 Tax=unclassified Pseudoalteromonas TaxID=194690 RepID=UPI00140CB313|nr:MULTISPECIES: SIS domain-containing protein [unclassified Pseudoalteromonas]MBH0020792.1 SIS domain-containing protein [Pseudoalteromonas sp. SWXJ133]MBH0059191.1 SIS domain-containing protein [Pseudoalteromonas sp. SWXJZ94C]
MTYLNYSQDLLKEKDAYWTAKEIQQQPACWDKVLSNLIQVQPSIDAFLKPILAKPNLRIIFTGAGTSAFVGESIAPAVCAKLGKRVEAIATTDLVSNPHDYFQSDIPTLLVSFARSGNSPESVASVDYADSLVKECYQLAITCNEEGELYKRCSGTNKFALLMPPETNDISFAMTSSFSSMMLSALYVFCPVENFKLQFEKSMAATESLITRYDQIIKTVANKKYERVIYLGSGIFKGLAREGALKLLELTDGVAVSSFDSPLGFRHGPKAIVNDKTLVILFISNHPLTRKYDLDLLTELTGDSEVGEIIVVDAKASEEHTGFECLSLSGMENAEDIFLLFPYIVCVQMYGFEHALAINNTPDNPSSSGTINRVVQGVNIYAL